MGSPRSPRESAALVGAELRDKTVGREQMASNSRQRYLQNRHSETSQKADRAHLPACPVARGSRAAQPRRSSFLGAGRKKGERVSGYTNPDRGREPTMTEFKS